MKLSLLLLAIAMNVAFFIEAKVLFQQTESTTCSDFRHFDKGKGSNVGGETCSQASNGVIAIYKPASSARAEVRDPGNIVIENGKKYYFSWRFMLTSTVTNNAIFQWKSYGEPMTQNYPIVIKFINGVLHVLQFQTPHDQNVLFRKQLSENQWYSHMIAISVSDQPQGGTIEYWFEGVQYELISHGDNKTIWPCKTWDGSSISPKFGIYGAVGTDITSNVQNLLVGETLQDMNYGNGSVVPSSGSPSKTSQSNTIMTIVMTAAATIAVTAGSGGGEGRTLDKQNYPKQQHPFLNKPAVV